MCYAQTGDNSVRETLVENAFQTGCEQQNIWTELLRAPEWFEPNRGCLGLVRWVRALSFSPKTGTLLLLFIPGGEQLKFELFEALKIWFLVFCAGHPLPSW